MKASRRAIYTKKCAHGVYGIVKSIFHIGGYYYEKDVNAYGGYCWNVVVVC